MHFVGQYLKKRHFGAICYYNEAGRENVERFLGKKWRAMLNTYKLEIWGLIKYYCGDEQRQIGFRDAGEQISTDSE